jgi:hypothetical protein
VWHEHTASFNGPKTWNSHGNKSGIYAGYFEHLPLHGTQLVLNSLGHTGMSAVDQQDDVVNELTQIFVVDFGMQLLKTLATMVCTDYVVFTLKI